MRRQTIFLYFALLYLNLNIQSLPVEDENSIAQDLEEIRRTSIRVSISKHDRTWRGPGLTPPEIFEDRSHRPFQYICMEEASLTRPLFRKRVIPVAALRDVETT